MDQVHIYLAPTFPKPAREIHASAAQVQIQPYGIVYFEAARGLEAQIIPWGQITHIALDREAAAELGFG